MQKLYSFQLVLLICTALFLITPPAKAQQKGLLWQITGKDVKGPAYLFGTVHLFDTTLYRLPEPVLAKMKETKQVYFELDFGNINPMEMMNGIMVKDSSQYLDKLLDTASLAKLKKIISTSPMLQMLGSNVYRLKPIFVSSFLLNDGKTPSVDMEMYKRAQQLKDTVGGIETVAEQMHAMDALSVDKQATMLKEMLKDYKSPESIIQMMTNVYVKQDIGNMMKEMNNNMPLDADFDEALLTKRNVIMADRIAALLGKRSTMIAVGAGHLGGEKGLIALLKKKGYMLKSVPFKFVGVGK